MGMASDVKPPRYTRHGIIDKGAVVDVLNALRLQYRLVGGEDRLQYMLIANARWKKHSGDATGTYRRAS